MIDHQTSSIIKLFVSPACCTSQSHEHGSTSFHDTSIHATMGREIVCGGVVSCANVVMQISRAPLTPPSPATLTAALALWKTLHIKRKWLKHYKRRCTPPMYVCITPPTVCSKHINLSHIHALSHAFTTPVASSAVLWTTGYWQNHHSIGHFPSTVWVRE